MTVGHRWEGKSVRQKPLSICAALIALALTSVPMSGSAQQVASNDGVAGPFRGFDGQGFGFDSSRFYRFASGPEGFLPWHQDRRRSIYLIDRVLEIDQIRTYITAVDIFNNTGVPLVVVTP